MNLDSRGKVLKIASFEGPKILRVGEHVPFKTISVLWKSLGLQGSSRLVTGFKVGDQGFKVGDQGFKVGILRFKVGILRLSTSGTSVVADSSLHGLDICCLVVGNKKPGVHISGLVAQSGVAF